MRVNDLKTTDFSLDMSHDGDWMAIVDDLGMPVLCCELDVHVHEEEPAGAAKLGDHKNEGADSDSDMSDDD